LSYDGCEAKWDDNGQSDFPPGSTPYPWAAVAGKTVYPFYFGGYRIGNYENEKYLWLLTLLYGSGNSPITLPNGLLTMQYQTSLLYSYYPDPLALPQSLIIWY